MEYSDIIDFERELNKRPFPVQEVEWTDLCSVLGIQDSNQPKPFEPEKKKRFRTIFTPFQLAGLEREYWSRKYLNKFRRATLAQHLSLSEKQISVWFQNRRMKDKKTKDSNVPVLPAPPMPVQEPQHQSMGQNSFYPMQSNVSWDNMQYFQPYYQPNPLASSQQNILPHDQPNILPHYQHTILTHNQENIIPHDIVPANSPQNYAAPNGFNPYFWRI